MKLFLQTFRIQLMPKTQDVLNAEIAGANICLTYAHVGNGRRRTKRLEKL